MFWELSFVDSYPSERRRIMYTNDIRDASVIWNQMDDKARELQDKREIELSVHVCRTYGIIFKKKYFNYSFSYVFMR